MNTSAPPTRAGQLVKSHDGKIGITTDKPRARTPQIPVMFVGAHYPVVVSVASVTTVDPDTLEELA